MSKVFWPFTFLVKAAAWCFLVLEAVALAQAIVARESIFWNVLLLWLILAYLLLPKLNRIMTKRYLPNYFIARARTGDGLLGDPVNIAFNGTKTLIQSAMKQAGWIKADELDKKTTLKMIVRTVMRKSYSSAPVSSLFLFGNKQDFAYQLEVGSSTSKRHHIRFWKVPTGFWLPGGKRSDWLAAATYDRKVGFSTLNLQITHKIEENIDIEREFVIKSLTKAGRIQAKKIEKHFVAGFRDRNGGGDRIKTDGSMPFITIN